VNKNFLTYQQIQKEEGSSENPAVSKNRSTEQHIITDRKAGTDEGKRSLQSPEGPKPRCNQRPGQSEIPIRWVGKILFSSLLESRQRQAGFSVSLAPKRWGAAAKARDRFLASKRGGPV